MRTLLVIAAACAAVVLTSVAPAPAHTGSAVFDVETERLDDRRVRLDVGITYSDDKEVASGAIVEVMANGPAGQELGPVRMRRGPDDRYVATVTLPEAGTWTFQLSSSFPPGSTTVTVDVPDDGDGIDTALVVALGVAALVIVAVAIVLRRLRRVAHGQGDKERA